MKTFNPCTWVRRVRYPKTTKGRKRFIQNSLNPVPVKVYFAYGLIILIGIAGLITTFYFMIVLDPSWLHWITGVASMFLILIGSTLYREGGES